jgi:hypothetical protein
LTGAVKLTLAAPFPKIAETLVGGSGTAPGVTEPEGADSTLSPLAFVACTVKV